MINNNQEWKDNDFSSRRGRREEKEEGFHKNEIMALQFQMTAMNNLLQSMTLTQVKTAGSLVQTVKQIEDIGCVICVGPHNTDACPRNMETIAFIRINPYSVTYNPG